MSEDFPASRRARAGQQQQRVYIFPYVFGDFCDAILNYIFSVEI